MVLTKSVLCKLVFSFYTGRHSSRNPAASLLLRTESTKVGQTKLYSFSYTTFYRLDCKEVLDLIIKKPSTSAIELD